MCDLTCCTVKFSRGQALRALGFDDIPDEVLVVIGKVFLGQSMSVKQVLVFVLAPIAQPS